LGSGEFFPLRTDIVVPAVFGYLQDAGHEVIHASHRRNFIWQESRYDGIESRLVIEIVIAPCDAIAKAQKPSQWEMKCHKAPWQ